MANTVLLLWPFVTLGLFAMLGREKGLIWSVVIGFLFLPEGVVFELPGLPDYQKMTAVAYSLLLAGFFMSKKRSWPGERVSHWDDRFMFTAFTVLFTGLAIGAVGTVFTNAETLVNADFIRQAMSWADLRHMTILPFLLMVPFFLGCVWLRTARHHTELLRVLVIAGLIYSLPTLYEARMSPQLNAMVYGYFPHSWIQHVRGGGFRPLVFLSHGLWLGFFLFSASAAAFALFRYGKIDQETEISSLGRIGFLFAGLFLMALTILSRNMGAAMLALMFVPFILFTTRRMQAWIATAVAIVFLTFPVFRANDLFPIDGVLSAVSALSEERAHSLDVRFTNEEALLERAAEKPVFGWGLWGRWRIVSEKGVDLTTVDSLWIITLGERGWVGFLATFGILCLPLFYLRRAARKWDIALPTTALALITAANLVYLLPNAMLGPVGWLAAGAVGGYVLSQRRDEEEVEAQSRETRYTRFNPSRDPAYPSHNPAYRR